MKMKEILFLLSIVFLCSCSNNEDSLPKSMKVDFINIGRGSLYGNGEEEVPKSNMIITNANDWGNLISQMNTVNNVSDNFTEVEINFNEFTVLAVFLEVKKSGWEIEIKSITENEESVILFIEETGFESSVITQPFHIVKIPKTNKKVVIGKV
ncbi:protease complex subunit PrcB family protein [Tenacibaculum caenipelagi]|uniref:Protease stability complex PrcB-like protein n=1 Tax=Tenacibaculum caenipelagi TaxID=1325435 RepID=A0A4R6TDC3_9FLAO|nr:protease complex subunit PrcB family protein [Tenacibaculum caenipelagi]TDQ23801.1 hypothetical protein DFQ07_2331 [Tenacibaculum caenipelagi]